MAYGYYQRLTKKHQRIYDASAKVSSVALPPAALPMLQARARALFVALRTERQPAVNAAAKELVRKITEALKVRAIDVRVRAVRPSSEDGELHGLYTREEDGRSKIEVWMRTAAAGRVVAPKTFLRTLLHEVVHHLDFEVLKLEETFHTEGFFQRESSLMRQLDVPKPQAPEAPAAEPESRAQKLRRLRKAIGAPAQAEQLRLFPD